MCTLGVTSISALIVNGSPDCVLDLEALLKANIAVSVVICGPVH